MKIEDVYKKEINDLIGRRGSTKFHITGIRHCDFKDKADDFIREAARKRLYVILQPEEANHYDPGAVSCYSGNKKVGYVSIYDLEKYQILAGKEDSDHLTGYVYLGNTGDHLLELSVAGTITLDDIRDYRKEIDKKKGEDYGLWEHDAIKRYLVHSRLQDDAKACIIQMKEYTVGLYGGYGSTTLEELSPILEQYKESSQYDISLEGQRDRWDILRYLDYLYDRWHMPGAIVDKCFEDILADVSSQIGGELGRSVSYKTYVERLTELVTTGLPSAKAAQHYLNRLPVEAFDDIRQQVESFPHHLYHLFHTDPEAFVRTLYYARIPRKYLDPFLSGIALVEAYENTCKLVDGNTPRSDEKKEKPGSREAILNELLALAEKGDWAEGVTAEDIQQMVCTVLGFGETKLDEEEKKLSEKLWQLFQGGRPGDLGRVRIGWENLVGFMLSKGLLVEKSAPLIDVDFFGNNNGFSNINKGKNHNNQSFKKIIPLLDKYCPQKDKKKN